MRLSRIAALLALLASTAAAPLAAAEPARRECVVIEEVVIEELGSTPPYVSDPQECALATAPASTFKLPHALIALATGVVEDPLATVPWDGQKRAFPSWNRDHSLDSAIKDSVVPFFQRTAGLIGRERMKEGLAQLGYAADTFEGELTTFWLNGDLAVTPKEQVDFLRRLFRGELPIEPRHAEALKAAFRMPEGQLRNASGTHDFVLALPRPLVVHAKTGNTSANGENLSWLVGEIETQGRRYVFASRVRSPEKLPGTAGAELVRRTLEARLGGSPGSP